MRPRTHASKFVSPLIVLYEDAVVTAAVSNIWISRLRHAVSAFAVGDGFPRRQWNRSPAVGAWTFERAFVLLCAVNVIRKLVVEIYVIELASWLVVLGAPGFAGIGRDGRASVVPPQQNLVVIGINPDHVIIAVRCFQLGESLGAVM